MSLIHMLQSRCTSLLHHPGVRLYGSNIFWLALEKLVRILVGFSIGILVARALGPKEYGLLNYSLSVVSIFAFAAGLGLDSILVRELVKNPEKRDILLGTSGLLKLLGGGVGVLVCAGLAFFSPIEGRWLIFIIGCGQLFLGFQVLEFYFQAQVKGMYIAIVQMIAVVCCAMLRLYFVWNDYALEWFAGVEAFYSLLSGLGYWIFFRGSGLRILNLRWNLTEAGALLRYSWPIIVSGGISMVYIRCDQIMIVGLLSEADNGQYAVAQRLLELIYIGGIICANSLFPSMVGTRHTSLLRYRKRIMLLIAAMFYASLLFFLPLSWGGHFFIDFFYGAQYALAGELFGLFCWKLLIVMPGFVLSNIYLAENLQGTVLRCSCLSAILYIPLAWWLLSLYGVWGAVWASIAISLFQLFVFPLMFRGGRFVLGIFWDGVCFGRDIRGWRLAK